MRFLSLYLLATLSSVPLLPAKGLLLFPRPRSLASQDPQSPEAAKPILTEADALLGKELKVVTKKERTASSGDPHDYFSIGIYWWPNPLTGGVPYLRRDGEYNPESKRYDRPKLEALGRDTLALASAYAVSKDPRYAERARRWLKAWFLDGETRMNPNLAHAQAWPGWTDGSPTGIIEGVYFAQTAPDAVTLLWRTGGLPAEEHEGIRKWFATLVRWLEESEPGRKIAEAENNHGSWYDMQRVSYYLFLGDTEKAVGILRQVGPRRIDRLIRADGRQPSELERTKAFDYSCYNLDALITLAEYGDMVGVDLWSYQGPQGGSIRKALDYLIPYARGSAAWPYQQLRGVSGDQLLRLLERASSHYPDAGYAEIMATWGKHRAGEAERKDSP